MDRSSIEAASCRIHDEWMKRNPKADWNAALHVPYEDLPEEEKEKDRVHVHLVREIRCSDVHHVREVCEVCMLLGQLRGVCAWRMGQPHTTPARVPGMSP